MDGSAGAAQPSGAARSCPACEYEGEELSWLQRHIVEQHAPQPAPLLIFPGDGGKVQGGSKIRFHGWGIRRKRKEAAKERAGGMVGRRRSGPGSRRGQESEEGEEGGGQEGVSAVGGALADDGEVVVVEFAAVEGHGVGGLRDVVCAS